MVRSTQPEQKNIRPEKNRPNDPYQHLARWNQHSPRVFASVSTPLSDEGRSGEALSPGFFSETKSRYVGGRGRGFHKFVFRVKLHGGAFLRSSKKQVFRSFAGHDSRRLSYLRSSKKHVFVFVFVRLSIKPHSRRWSSDTKLLGRSPSLFGKLAVWIDTHHRKKAARQVRASASGDLASPSKMLLCARTTHMNLYVEFFIPHSMQNNLRVQRRKKCVPAMVAKRSRRISVGDNGPYAIWTPSG